jgi:atypical dual specificity phosphatase
MVDDTLLVGCAPMSLLDHPTLLNKLGVHAVINMCYEYDGPKSSYAKLDIKQLHQPTIDHTEVSLGNILQAIDFIKKYKSRGERVLVHCKAGNGRAASIALCWMMHEQKEKTSMVR